MTCFFYWNITWPPDQFNISSAVKSCNPPISAVEANHLAWVAQTDQLWSKYVDNLSGHLRRLLNTFHNNSAPSHSTMWSNRVDIKPLSRVLVFHARDSWFLTRHLSGVKTRMSDSELQQKSPLIMISWWKRTVFVAAVSGKWICRCLDLLALAEVTSSVILTRNRKSKHQPRDYIHSKRSVHTLLFKTCDIFMTKQYFKDFRRSFAEFFRSISLKDK